MTLRLPPRAALAPALLALLPAARPARAISFEAVPAPLAGERSPDGRWAARVEEPTGKAKRARIVFTDTRAGTWARRPWAITIVARSEDSYPPYSSSASVTWRPDSRAAAIHSGDGWRVAFPGTQRVRLISHAIGSADVAWAPRSGRLALFGNWGDPLYMWGGRLSGPKTWVPSDYPEPNEAHIWQADWSPDESAILVRFYGHAERGPESGGHTAVISPRTGRALYGWGDEARLAAWLDGKRLAYLRDNDGLAAPGELIVAQPGARSQARRYSTWLSDVVAWTLAPRRATMWALRLNGDLMRSPSRSRAWKKMRRLTNKVPGQYLSGFQASPNGDVLAITQSYGGYKRSVSIVSTGPRPWITSWAAPSGTIELLGWEPGHSLPRLAWTPRENAPARIIQLKWR